MYLRNRFTVSTTKELEETTIEEASVREVHGVIVLAIRHNGSWSIAPRGSHTIAAGDDLLVVGSKSDLDAFGEVAA
jgi:Trk K+ transport system NAD-binding subunit